MNTPKLIVVSLFLGATLYALIATSALLVTDSEVCNSNPTIMALAPWSSGCYFDALYKEAASKEELDSENSRLNEFINNGGVAPDVLRYRFQLHQKYQNYFRTNFQDLHRMHEEYTRVNHHRIEHQIEYLEFLMSRDLSPLAQSTLDSYCTTYVLNRRDDILDTIQEYLQQANLPLSLAYCRDNRR